MASRIDFLVDTNFVIYYLRGDDSIAGYELYRFAASVITELELLVKPDLSATAEAAIRQFLASCPIFDLSSAVKDRAILIARQHRLKLPDALIAATALVADLPLVTADRQFTRVADLNLLLLEL